MAKIVSNAEITGEDRSLDFQRAWIAEIDRAEKYFNEWFVRGRNIIRRFRDQREYADYAYPIDYNRVRRYNILWANTKLLQPTLYAQMPKPEVERSHKDKDPVARLASQILQRALEYDMKRDGFDATMKSARDDYLLPGRGTAWVHYMPVNGKEAITPDVLYFDSPEEAVSQSVTPENAHVEVLYSKEQDKYYVQPDPFTPIIDEMAPTEAVLWEEFLHTPTENWGRVWWVARVHALSREQLKELFGDEVGEQIELDSMTLDRQPDTGGVLNDKWKRARIYEVWDKKTQTVQWISRGFQKGPIARVTDPLGLDGFFPCPVPLYATITTDSLIPLPDYAMYQDQAAELDRLTARIGLIQNALRIVGIYNARSVEIKNMLGDTGLNEMIPVTNWGSWAEKGGMANNMEWMPIEVFANALKSLYEARETVKQELYEITGLSDILRGSTDPNETLGAQQLKGQYAGKRIIERQKEVAEFARQLIELKAQIICNKFDPATIRMQSGFDVMLGVGDDPTVPPEQRPAKREEMWQAALKLLKSPLLRSFRISIETDSTIAQDQAKDKAERIEFVTSMSGFLQQAVPALAQFPMLGPMVGEIMMFGVRGFSGARGMEKMLESALDDMQDALRQGQSPVPPPQNPEQAPGEDPAIAQGQMEIEKQRLQLEAQTAERAHELEMLRAKAELTRAGSEGQSKVEIEQLRLQSQERMKQIELQYEREKCEREERVKMLELALEERRVTVEEGRLRLEQQQRETDATLGGLEHALREREQSHTEAHHEMEVAEQAHNMDMAEQEQEQYEREVDQGDDEVEIARKMANKPRPAE